MEDVGFAADMGRCSLHAVLEPYDGNTTRREITVTATAVEGTRDTERHGVPRRGPAAPGGGEHPGRDGFRNRTARGEDSDMVSRGIQRGYLGRGGI